MKQSYPRIELQAVPHFIQVYHCPAPGIRAFVTSFRSYMHTDTDAVADALTPVFQSVYQGKPLTVVQRGIIASMGENTAIEVTAALELIQTSPWTHLRGSERAAAVTLPFAFIAATCTAVLLLHALWDNLRVDGIDLSEMITIVLLGGGTFAVVTGTLSHMWGAYSRWCRSSGYLGICMYHPSVLWGKVVGWLDTHC